MDMFRVTARWTGFTGSPGYSNFFFSSGFLDGGLLNDEAQLLSDRVVSAFDALTQILPGSVTITTEPEVAVIDSDSGMATNFSIVDQDSVNGGASGSMGYPGPSGAVVTWRTDDLRNGRRIRGRTFLVPLSNTAFEGDGTLRENAIGYLNNFADTLVGGSLDGDLGVWSRPVGGSGGVFATVTGYSIPDMVAVLRSRRD